MIRLWRDSSYEEEEENPLKKLEEIEAKEFYNMVRSIFSSANISLKNEQLYSPLLEALIKNYSNKLWQNEQTPGPKRRQSTNGVEIKKAANQFELMRMASSMDLNKEWKPKIKKKIRKIKPQEQLSSIHLSKKETSSSAFDVQNAWRLHESPSKHSKHAINDATIKKIYRSELRLRSRGKELSNLDKLWMDLVGPIGSREYLHKDMELIDDLLCKQLYNKDKIKTFNKLHDIHTGRLRDSEYFDDGDLSSSPDKSATLRHLDDEKLTKKYTTYENKAERPIHELIQECLKRS